MAKLDSNDLDAIKDLIEVTIDDVIESKAWLLKTTRETFPPKMSFLERWMRLWVSWKQLERNKLYKANNFRIRRIEFKTLRPNRILPKIKFICSSSYSLPFFYKRKRYPYPWRHSLTNYFKSNRGWAEGPHRPMCNRKHYLGTPGCRNITKD